MAAPALALEAVSGCCSGYLLTLMTGLTRNPYIFFSPVFDRYRYQFYLTLTFSFRGSLMADSIYS